MAGAAPDLGEAIFLGALAPIFAAITGDQTPTQVPIPQAPSIARSGLIAGISTGTLLVLGLGALVLFKLAK